MTMAPMEEALMTRSVADAVDFASVQNVNEQYVIEAIKARYAIPNTYCKCSLCIQDIYAKTLNALPARYKQNTGINLNGIRHRAEIQTEIAAAVEQAMEVIAKIPIHG